MTAEDFRDAEQRRAREREAQQRVGEERARIAGVVGAALARLRGRDGGPRSGRGERKRERLAGSRAHGRLGGKV
jgi:hypothetical protein